MMKAITEKCSTVKKIISAITFCACFALFVNQLIICIEKFNHMETLIQLELVRWVESYIQQISIILQILNNSVCIYVSKQGEFVRMVNNEN